MPASSGAEFQSSSGKSSEEVFLEIERMLTPRQEHLLLAGKGQHTRILDRTAAGVDVDGVPFASYDTTRPYYYRPWDTGSSKKFGGRTLSLVERRIRTPESSRIRSARRFIRVLGGRQAPKGSAETHVLRHKGVIVGSILRREPDTVKFSSYDAFKRSLGRSGVDLTGPSAPHMMQTIQVSAGTDYIRLSIEDPEKAAIATGHNFGTSRGGKRRHFFGASQDDPRLMLLDILNAMTGEGAL